MAASMVANLGVSAAVCLVVSMDAKIVAHLVALTVGCSVDMLGVDLDMHLVEM